MNDLELSIKREYEKRGYDVIKVGIPDLICLKDNKILFIECKSRSDRLSSSQLEALRILRKNRFRVKIEGAGSERARRDYLTHKYGVMGAWERMTRV